MCSLINKRWSTALINKRFCFMDVSKVFHLCFTSVSNDPVPKTRVSKVTTEQHYPSVVT